MKHKSAKTSAKKSASKSTKKVILSFKGAPPIKGEKSFFASINKAIARGEHVDALKGIIKEFEDYKSYMGNVFVKDEPAYESIFKFHVEYLLKKPVWREFEMEGNQSLEELADGVIDSMDWDDDHAHAFFFPKENGSGDFMDFHSPYSIDSQYFDNDQYPTYHSNNIRIAEIDHAKFPTINFVFDFGDGHQFSIRFLEMRSAKKSDCMAFMPKMIDQRGVGPEQYPDFLIVSLDGRSSSSMRQTLPAQGQSALSILNPVNTVPSAILRTAFFNTNHSVTPPFSFDIHNTVLPRTWQD